VSAPPEGIRTKGRDLQSLLKRGAANFIRRLLEPEALLAEIDKTLSRSGGAAA